LLISDAKLIPGLYTIPLIPKLAFWQIAKLVQMTFGLHFIIDWYYKLKLNVAVILSYTHLVSLYKYTYLFVY